MRINLPLYHMFPLIMHFPPPFLFLFLYIFAFLWPLWLWLSPLAYITARKNWLRMNILLIFSPDHCFFVFSDCKYLLAWDDSAVLWSWLYSISRALMKDLVRLKFFALIFELRFLYGYNVLLITGSVVLGVAWFRCCFCDWSSPVETCLQNELILLNESVRLQNIVLTAIACDSAMPWGP